MKQSLRAGVDVKTAIKAASNIARSTSDFEAQGARSNMESLGKTEGKTKGLAVFGDILRWVRRVLPRPDSAAANASVDDPIIREIHKVDQNVSTHFDQAKDVLDKVVATSNSAITQKLDQLQNELLGIDHLRSEILAQRDSLASLLKQFAALTYQLDSRLPNIETYSAAAARRVVTPAGDNSLMIRTEAGYILCPQDDSPLVAALIETGDLERGTRLLISKLLKPGDVFVDVGANIGMHTLAAASAMRGAGHIFAFEPFPTSCKLLSRSLAIGGFSGMTKVFQLAVSDKKERRRLYLGPTAGHHSFYQTAVRTTKTAPSVTVETVRLDDAIPRKTIVNLIKIDVEGAELAVLSSARQTIAHNPDIALIVEFGPSHLERTKTSPEQWIHAFYDLGLQYQVIDEVNGTLRQIELQALKQMYWANLLFARPDSTIWAKLAQ